MHINRKLITYAIQLCTCTEHFRSLGKVLNLLPNTIQLFESLKSGFISDM